MGVLAVLGGTGFVGRAVADAARQAGYTPVLLAPESPAGAEAHARQAPVVACDVADRASVDQALADLAPSAVAHLAAFGSGQQGLLAGATADPREAVTVNVGGFLNVVEAAAQVGVDRVVWSSSTTVYGPPERYGHRAVDEDAALAPQTVYGATKAAAELLSPSLEATTGVRAVALRLPLVYGPGRWYGGSQQGLVTFVRDLAAGQPASLQASEDDADWLYVADAARAFVAALQAPQPRHAYNLVGHRSSLAQVGRALAARAQGPAEITVVYDPPLPLPATHDGAARRDLGFAPQFDLERAAADYLARTEVLDEHT